MLNYAVAMCAYAYILSSLGPKLFLIPRNCAKRVMFRLTSGNPRVIPLRLRKALYKPLSFYEVTVEQYTLSPY